MYVYLRNIYVPSIYRKRPDKKYFTKPTTKYFHIRCENTYCLHTGYFGGNTYTYILMLWIRYGNVFWKIVPTGFGLLWQRDNSHSYLASNCHRYSAWSSISQEVPNTRCRPEEAWPMFLLLSSPTEVELFLAFRSSSSCSRLLLKYQANGLKMTDIMPLWLTSVHTYINNKLIPWRSEGKTFMERHGILPRRILISLYDGWKKKKRKKGVGRSFHSLKFLGQISKRKIIKYLPIVSISSRLSH